jgi:endonuclease YncB( thermonuclease family)
MSLASRLLTALVGLALIWYLWPFGGDTEVVKMVEPPLSGHQGRLFTRPLPDDDPPPESPAPAKATQAPPKDDALGSADGDKTAALAPEAAQKPKPKLKATRFYRVIVRDGGTLETRGDIVITLEGIGAYAADETCKDAKGRTWSCGKSAQVALTRLIRGRAIVCKVPAMGKLSSVTARCTLAGTDLSTWMVAQGWAKPAAPTEPKLAKAADAARKKKIGVWR